MKRLAALGILITVLSVSGRINPTTSDTFPTIAAAAQFVPECSNCAGADWGREWNPSSQICTSNPMVGCGLGCNCFLGFLMLPDPDETDFFGGAFTRDGGFRVDRPGLLARARVQQGDVIYLLNGVAPTKTALARFTRQRPARRVLATWNSQGRLAVRLYH